MSVFNAFPTYRKLNNVHPLNCNQLRIIHQHANSSAHIVTTAYFFFLLVPDEPTAFEAPVAGAGLPPV